ncbi:MAG: hypothetical protein ACRC33_06355 [Gemmataceae bacterium]
MAMKKNIGKKGAAARRSTITVGDIVQIKFGTGDVKGRIVEDRGHIGFKGRNLYRILVTMDGDEPMNIELPADEIRICRRAPVAKKAVRPRPVKATKVHAQPQ